MARSLNCGLHQEGGWQEVLIERRGPPVQSGQILPHGVGKVCEGCDRGGGLHQGGGWQKVLIVDFTKEVDGKKS